MIALLLFMFLLSKINCRQITNYQNPGILQARPQEYFHNEELLQLFAPHIPLPLDKYSHAPNIQAQAQQELIGRPELPSASQNPREILASLRTRLSSLSSPNTPANCEESIRNSKRMVGPQSQNFHPEIRSSLGADILTHGNGAGISNSHEPIGYMPQLYQPQLSSPGAEFRLTYPLDYESVKNMPVPFRYPQLGNTETPAFQSINSNSFALQNPNYIPRHSQNPHEISTEQPPLDPFISSLSASLPSPVMPSKPPRSRIPSPLTLMDSPSSYDVSAHTFGTPEPILTSTVGCLELTVTPYGTISETPLPEPSTPLPRGPFLPVASPVSALAPPFSSLLPSAMPNAKSSSFLTKVPVPPPFI